MKIGIIGAGKVGCSLGKYLKEAGISVTGFYSQTAESAVEAAQFTNTTMYARLENLVEASDTLFITTPDGAIKKIWDCIAKFALQDKIICHFSGSLSSELFSGIKETGAVGCSIHPMYAFSDKYTSYQQLNTAFFTMEGMETAVSVMKQLFEKLGHKVLTVRSEDKIKYHAAAAMASNYMVGLFQTSLNLLSECGFSEEDARHLLTPLVEGNVKSMLSQGTKQALTGPVERNDLETVSKHLQALHGTNAEVVYRSLGNTLTEIAKKKNPDRDYTALGQLLKVESDSK